MPRGQPAGGVTASATGPLSLPTLLGFGQRPTMDIEKLLSRITDDLTRRVFGEPIAPRWTS